MDKNLIDKPLFNILIVEDQYIIANVEIRELHVAGYNVMHVNCGELAVEMVAKSEIPIHLILMDIDLGEGIDGIETAEKINQLCEIPIVFLSSHTEQSVLEKTENTTAYGFVPKNSSQIVMDNAIKMALRLFNSNRELKIQKDLYEDLYQNAPCGYHSISTDGYVTRINETALSMLGYEREDVISKMKITDLISSPDGDEHINDCILKIKQTNLELFYKKKDDSLLPVIFNSEILSDTKGQTKIIKAIFSDISKQIITDYELRKTNYELVVHQIELELQNEELKLHSENDRLTPEKFAIIFEESPLGYISLDPSGKILDLNNSCASIFQIDRSLLTGRNMHSFLAEFKNPFDTFLNQVFQGSFNVSCDLRLNNEHINFKDINLRKINVSENDRCFLLIFNISDLKQHQSHLKLFHTEIM